MSALELSNAVYFFPLASSIVILMTFVHVHTLTFLLPKTIAGKKLSHKILSAKIKRFLEILNSRNSKKNRQISSHGFQVGSQK